MNYLVRLGPTYFPDSSRNRPIRYGRIYIGAADTDPTITANQIDVTALLEDGTELALSQPILTSAGGVPVYNGSPVTLKVGERYSLSVLNQSGTLEYYVASNFAADDDDITITADSLQADAGIEIPVNNAGYDCDFRVESTLSQCAFFMEASSSNFGFNNCTLKSWDSDLTALQFGGTASLYTQTAESPTALFSLMNNAYFDGSNYRYFIANEATRYYQFDGYHTFQSAVTGGAPDNPITWDHLLTIGPISTVFNEDGDAIDFRIESDTNANAFFLEGSSSNIGIGITTFGSGTGGTIAIANSTAPSGNPTGGGLLYVDSADNNIKYRDASGNISDLTLTGSLSGDIVFNESGGNYDFRIESNSNPNAFFLEGSSNVIGIGTGNIETWSAGYHILQLASNSSMMFSSNHGVQDSLWIFENVYWNSGYYYQDTDEASMIRLVDGRIDFATAASGTADTAVAWQVPLSMTPTNIIFNDSNPVVDIDFRIQSALHSRSFYMQGSSGNIGFKNGSLEAWNANYTALQIGGNSSIIAETTPAAGNTITINNNAYYDVAWKYISADEASRYYQDDGAHYFSTAIAGGAPDAALSWIELLHFSLTETVFNEAANDIDYRIETSINTHTIFVEGSSGNVGINNSAPAYDLDIKSGASGDTSLAFTPYTSGNPIIMALPATGDRLTTYSGGNPLIDIYPTGSVFNEDGADLYFRVESNSNPNAFFLEGSSSNIGLNNGSLEAWLSTYTALQIGGNAAIFSTTSPGASNFLNITMNAFYDGAWKYMDSDYASYYIQNNGNHLFSTANTGTAENAITWVDQLRLKLAETVFNEGGANIDFRVESAVNANSLFIEGSSGNVGIGTGTLESWESTWTALQIGGNANLSGETTGAAGNSFSISQNAFFNGTNWIYQDTDQASRYYQIDGRHYFQCANSGTEDTAITWEDVFNVNTNRQLINDGKRIDFGDGSDLRITHDGTNNRIETYNGEIRIYSGSTEAMIVCVPNGAVNLYYDNTLSLATSAGGLVTMLATYSHDMNGETYRDLLINDSGELGYDSSTIRKKTNVVDMEDIGWLYDLRPVNFEYKRKNDKGTYLNEGNGKKKYGLIAEELEAVNNDFVFYDEDGRTEGIQYRELIPVLIKSLQEQNSEINSLKRIIAEIL